MKPLTEKTCPSRHIATNWDTIVYLKWKPKVGGDWRLGYLNKTNKHTNIDNSGQLKSISRTSGCTLK